MAAPVSPTSPSGSRPRVSSRYFGWRRTYVDSPFESYGLALNRAILIFEHEPPGKFVTAHRTGVAARTSEKRAHNRIFRGRSFPVQFAVCLISVLIGPHGSAHHATAAVIEHDRLCA